MSDAAFFVQQARAAGRTPDPQDINPMTGKARSAFDGLNDAPMARNRRIMRSPNMGMTTGSNPQRKILGVDAQQKAESDYSYEHRNDAFFKAARAARQADPLAGHETAAQFAANNDAETPPGAIQPAIPRPPKSTPAGTVAVSGGGQDVIPAARAGTVPPPAAGVVRYSGYRKGAGLVGAPPAPAPDDGAAPALPFVSSLMPSAEKVGLTLPPLPASGPSRLPISVATGPNIMSSTTIPDPDPPGPNKVATALLKKKKTSDDPDGPDNEGDDV